MSAQLAGGLLSSCVRLCTAALQTYEQEQCFCASAILRNALINADLFCCTSSQGFPVILAYLAGSECSASMVLQPKHAACNTHTTLRMAVFQMGM